MKSTVQFLCVAILIAWAPLKADSFETILSNLNLDRSIANEIENGLEKLAGFNGIVDKVTLFELFEDMNETLKTAYNAQDMDINTLTQNMSVIPKKITTLKTGVAAINVSNFTSNKTTYMSNALYLALMGKTLKYYLLKKHKINLSENATYAEAFAVLVKVGELPVTQEFIKLGQLLNIFHIKFEWLPVMLEQM